MIKGTVAEKNLIEKHIIGTRDLRANLSNLIEKVLNNGTEVIAGHAKKNDKKTVSIIATSMLDSILETYKFNPIVTFDEKTGQYLVGLDEIKVYTVADEKEYAVNDLIDLIIDTTEDYFENSDLYTRMPDYKSMYPYFLRIHHCNTRDELREMLNLK
jgi:hypothetical protein